MFEILTNEDETAYAARLSGQEEFILRTSASTQYTRVIFAVPYGVEDTDGLADTLKKAIREIRR